MKNWSPARNMPVTSVRLPERCVARRVSARQPSASRKRPGRRAPSRGGRKRGHLGRADRDDGEKRFAAQPVGAAPPARSSSETVQAASSRRRARPRRGRCRGRCGSSALPVSPKRPLSSTAIARLAGRLGGDGGQRAEAHQHLAIAGEHQDAAVGLRQSEAEADHGGAAHRAPEVEIERRGRRPRRHHRWRSRAR